MGTEPAISSRYACILCQKLHWVLHIDKLHSNPLKELLASSFKWRKRQTREITQVVRVEVESELRPC